MIISVKVDWEKLISPGKKYPWKKEKICFCCKGKIWGHGFVAAWFDRCEEAVFLKLQRCIDCRTVFRFRPSTHFKGFYYSIQTILKSLQNKIYKNQWISGIGRSLQYIRMNAFKIRIFLSKKGSYSEPEIALFPSLFRSGITPVSRSKTLKHNVLFAEPT